MMEEKKKNKISVAYCGGMIMMFSIIGYVINLASPTYSSYAYFYVVGPATFLLGLVVLIIGLIIRAAKKKK